jgi:choline dehydrogenase-like flavoprotein
MITDLRNVPGEASIEADICVIGAGAAGIVIAKELSSSPIEVVLLESGGYGYESRVQDLYRGTSTGEKYYKPLDECRTRRFGGSTNCWGGICTPLNPVDFTRRSWVPWSGWPVHFDDLKPWLRKAHAICSPGPYLYDGDAWEAAGLPHPQFDPGLFTPFVWQFNNRSEINFGRKFRADLRASSNVHVFLNANATELLTNESGRVVERARVRTFEGITKDIRAKIFVLACGGIENARILLASDSTHPNGLGNNRDIVGRFFHEHLQMRCGFLVPAKHVDYAPRCSRLSKLGETWCLPGLVLSRDVQTRHETLNASIAIDPYHDPEGAFMALQNAREDLKDHKFSERTMRNLWKAARGSGKVAPEAWRRFVLGDRPKGDGDRFHLYARAEQAPNPDSRVTLSDDTDPLGMRRARLDWRTTALDRKAIRLVVKSAAAEFKRLGWGEVIEAGWLEGEVWPDQLDGGPHHMGTTRMSSTPYTGVVDADCRVHDLDGLYVAGSSIFPTGGHANPTLTIVAFAARLADHLRRALARESSGSGVGTVAHSAV